VFKNRKFIYALSLVLGGIGFISTYFIHDQYLLFASFILIGCAWAAMLALPFTILTNALSGSHMGTYLGLFNGTICIPQIVAASLGGSILGIFTTKGMFPPEINMLVIAGIMLIIGAICVFLVKETKGEL
jgi:maltose/moltooligosaccharide transporter